MTNRQKVERDRRALTYYSEPENTKKRTGAWLAI